MNEGARICRKLGCIQKQVPLRLVSSPASSGSNVPKRDPAAASFAKRCREDLRFGASAEDLRNELLLVASLLLVVRPGAPSSVPAPTSDALCS